MTLTITSAGLALGFVILMNIFTVLLERLVDLLKDKRPTASKVLGIIATVTKAFGLGLAGKLGL